MREKVRLLFLFVLALTGFSLVFLGIGFGFWPQMALTVLMLCGLSHMLFPREQPILARGSWLTTPGAVVVGLGSAVLLYLVFFAGYRVVGHFVPGGREQVAAVYGFKRGVNTWLIAVLIGAIIAPGEELFWRGYLQVQLEKHYGIAGSVLAALAYAAVHVASGNPVLVLAALVCGSFWVLLYRYTRSIWANILSHVLWDLAVFLVIPFGSG